MHRLPFISGHKKRMDSKSSRRGKSATAKHSPKLERSIALRNVDYEPSTSSSSSYNGSLDLDRMRSFRIDGTGGGIEGMFRDLGLSADDFVIPAAEWEAMKVRSSSDPLPFLSDSTGLIVCEDSEVCMVNPLRSDCDVGGFGTSQDARVCGTVDGLDDRLRCDSVVLDETESARLVHGNDGRRGIKGLKPPTLTTPSPMSLPLVDDSCSTWDIVNAFVPNEDRESDFNLPGRLRPGGEVGYIEGAQEWAGEDGDVKNDIGTRLTNEVLSPSSSFTTNSNDDDSSSTTTEPMSVISPNGKFLRIITGWQKGGLLGSGSFGTVYEGIADGGFFFAVKEVSLLDQCEEGKQRICNLEHEIALLRQFEHENIVQYYGTEKDDSKLYIFLELVSKGSLLELYQKYWLRDSQVSRYTRQILLGLKYLHDQNVIHRDIKCANILVDTNGSVKLADFGLAKSIKLNDVKSCKGTAFWMAPEVVNRRSGGYGLAADIWSLGCTVLEMLTRQFPYSNLENHMQAIFRIGKGEPPHVPNTLSDDALDFIHSCLQVDPIARPSASQLLEHPFVKQPLTSSTSVSASASPRCVGRIGAF